MDVYNVPFEHLQFLWTNNNYLKILKEEPMKFNLMILNVRYV